MTLFHEAYLFEPEEFARVVAPLMHASALSREGYSLVRSEAIRLFDTNAQVRVLADEYGGWDRQGILTEIPEDEPRHVGDVAFWLVLLVYGSVRKVNQRLGLAGNWEFASDMLKRLGWDNYQRECLISGHSFRYFGHRYLSDASESGDAKTDAKTVWDYMNRSFQSGTIGWLDLVDNQSLMRTLREDQDKLFSLHSPFFREVKALPSHNQDDITTDRAFLQTLHQSAIDMLDSAIRNRNGLCVIISG